MQRMQRQCGVTKPVAEFDDLAAIAPIEVLFGTEDLHSGHSRVPNPVEPDRSQSVVQNRKLERACFIVQTFCVLDQNPSDLP